ncbi:hypothetical protein TM1040_0116 [Ruegeria sp. TM1040]|nr:hypothetical protein TM1040_0116 [Ruegeria sp. TM1040]
MTVMLERLRQLEAARKRGDLTDAQYRDARSKLLSVVEDAEVEPTGPRPRTTATRSQAARPRSRPAAPAPTRRAAPAAAPHSDSVEPQDMSFFWGLVLVGLCGAAMITFLIGRLIGDITIALTLAVTVVAAVVIAAFQRMQG